MSDLLTGLFVGCGFLALVIWTAFGIYADVRKRRNRDNFATGEYAPTQSRLVRDLLNNIQNYKLPKAWADREKFQCPACCCKKLKFTWKSVKLITRIKDDVAKEVYNLLDAAKINYDRYLSELYFLPCESVKLDFQYLEGHCSSCGKFDGEYHTSGGKCNPDSGVEHG